jgi:hypothetical protein
LGKKIEHFIGFEPNCDSKMYRRWAQILGELELRDGLSKEINLDMGDMYWCQNIGYWKLPFH